MTLAARYRSARARAVPAVSPLLPRPLKRGLRRTVEALDPVRVRRYRRRSGDRLPIPPKLLRERVGATTVASWVQTGERYGAAVHRGAAAAGTTLPEAGAVLDFGCGAGKVLRHLARTPGVQLAGCDIHGPSIAWLARAHPGIDARVTPFRPPLSYPAGAFGLVYLWSVFTHLEEDNQDAWLRELSRVLRPGGVCLISILGPGTLEAPVHKRPRVADPRSVREELDARGFSFRPAPVQGAAALDWSGTDELYGVAFQTPERACTRWAATFDVVTVLPRELDDLQDVVVLRKPPRDGDAGT